MINPPDENMYVNELCPNMTLSVLNGVFKPNQKGKWL